MMLGRLALLALAASTVELPASKPARVMSMMRFVMVWTFMMVSSWVFS